MKFVLKKDKIPGIAILAILLSGFIIYGIAFAPHAKAFTPQQCIANAGSAQQTFTGSWTSSESSAVLNTINLTNICGLAGTMVVISLNFWVPGAGYTVFLTDNITDSWFRQGGGQSYTCSATTGIGGTTCTALAPMITIIFATILTQNTNRLSITANNPGGGNFPFNSNIGASWMVIPGGSVTSVSGCVGFIATRSNGTQITVNGMPSPQPCFASVPPGDFVLTGETYSYSGVSGVVHEGTSAPVNTQNTVGFQNANCPANAPGLGTCQILMGYYGNTGNTIQTLQFGFVCNTGCTTGGGGGNWFSVVAIVFGSVSGVTTSTTVVNTNVGGGGANHNSSGTTNFTPKMPQLNFYASLNTASIGQIDNVTLKIGAVHITQSIGVGFVAVYMPQAPIAPPSVSNPYVLAASGVAPFPIFNNTPGFVHVNPQTVICPLCYFAIGFVTNTTASRTNTGAWSGTSGVSFFETSTPTEPEYKFAITGTIVPPSPMFSSTLKTPYDWLFFHETYTVATFTLSTTTSTVTLTIGGTATTTSTATATSTYVVNQSNPANTGFWFLPMFYILIFFAIFSGIGIFLKGDRNEGG